MVTEDSSREVWLWQARSYLRNADPVLDPTVLSSLPDGSRRERACLISRLLAAGQMHTGQASGRRSG